MHSLAFILSEKVCAMRILNYIFKAECVKEQKACQTNDKAR
jgi:hypothetical protein